MDGQLEAAFCLGYAYEHMVNPVASIQYYEACQVRCALRCTGVPCQYMRRHTWLMHDAAHHSGRHAACGSRPCVQALTHRLEQLMDGCSSAALL